MTNKSATAAARAAGHAVATAHMADHCLGAALYALKAVEATGAAADVERVWQMQQLPNQVWELVVSALENRLMCKRRRDVVVAIDGLDAESPSGFTEPKGSKERG
jgi:hypothetical protein